MVKWLGALISGTASVIAYELLVKLDERAGWTKIFIAKLKINSKARVRIFNFALIMIFFFIVYPSLNNNSIYSFTLYGIFMGAIIAFGMRITNTVSSKEDIIKKPDLNKEDEAENKK